VSDIVDGHHHIWRQADLPWLTGPMQPRIFGPYEPIRRDYPIREYLDDLKGTGVTRSVYVQTNWANDRFEDEAAWVQQTADEHERVSQRRMRAAAIGTIPIIVGAVHGEKHRRLSVGTLPINRRSEFDESGD